MTNEEKIVELETNCKAMTEVIEKLKAELAEKDKHETVWIPKRYDSYKYINSQGEVADTYVSENDTSDKFRIDFNNVYSLSYETQEHLKWYSNSVLRIQNRLMQLHELLCPDYFPDWKNAVTCKFYLYYNCTNNTWGYDSELFLCKNVIYFTKEAAEKACAILNREKFMM